MALTQEYIDKEARGIIDQAFKFVDGGGAKFRMGRDGTLASITFTGQPHGVPLSEPNVGLMLVVSEPGTTVQDALTRFAVWVEATADEPL